MGFSVTARNQALDGITVDRVSLHSGDPGTRRVLRPRDRANERRAAPPDDRSLVYGVERLSGPHEIRLSPELSRRRSICVAVNAALYSGSLTSAPSTKNVRTPSLLWI